MAMSQGGSYVAGADALALKLLTRSDQANQAPESTATGARRRYPVLPADDIRHASHPYQFALKRAIDIVVAVVGGLLTLPLLALVAVAIKLDSAGPVLFSQMRAGVGGKPYRMYKFRTMSVDADRIKYELQSLNDSGDIRLFKIKNDPRVTRVGKWLRKSSLDELPQLFNVLSGDMSLVGPRPFFPEDLESYEDHHFERLHVLPGITGLWQVSGRSDIMDFEQVVHLDRTYIRNWSILRDLWILLKTPLAAFGRGAY